MSDIEFATQPHNIDAEKAVIGSVLIDQDSFFEISEHIVPNDFYILRHQWIWEAIIFLSENKTPIDPVTIRHELEKENRFSEIGGSAFIMEMVNHTPSSIHAESYAKIVKDYSIRRKLLFAANEIARQAYDEKKSTDDVVSESMSSVLAVATDATSGKIHNAAEVFENIYMDVDELSQKPVNEYPGVQTGFYDLDRLLGGGMQKNKLYVLGGRPGQGKTSLLMSIIHNIAFKNKVVGVFSLEMNNSELGNRLISIDAEIDGQTLQTGKLDDDQWTLFTNSIERLSSTQILFDDSARLNPSQLRAKCKRIQAQHGLDLVILDYLGLMLSDQKYNSRVDQVSEISRSLKLLAKELDIPVLVAHQLSREVEKRQSNKPILSDLRDSGSVEQDADSVWFIYRDLDIENLGHLNVGKHRNGPVGDIDLHFNESCTKFSSYSNVKYPGG